MLAPGGQRTLPCPPRNRRECIPEKAGRRYAARVQPHVVIEGSPERQEELRRNETVFGRGVAADVQVVHGLVSRLHASVRKLADGGWVLQDMGSSNGTWVGEQRVTRHVLRDGDRVCLGGAEGPMLRFHLPEDTFLTPTPQPSIRQTGQGKGHTAVLSALKLPPDQGLIRNLASAQADEDPGRTAFFSGLDLRRRHLQLLVDGFGVQSFEVSVFHPVKVGRDRVLNGVCLPHPSVSVEHAIVRIDDSQKPVVEDLESTNGTFVNGTRVRGIHPLKEGDLITFGTFASRSLIFRDSAREEVAVDTTRMTEGRLTIGRDPSCDLILAHVLISRRHAELTEVPQGYVLRDLGSQNGTYVNDERITEHKVQENDHIRIGPYHLVFHRGELQRSLDGAAVAVAARNLFVQVPTDEGPITLLHDVSLMAGRREIVAIIGSSGSGKSTLLSSLAGLMPVSQGQVLYNGSPLHETLDKARALIGYVPQHDVLHGELTVEQCLEHAARLRLPKETSGLERYEQVQRVIALLELEDRRHTEVGQLSGGQKKRVSIGLELLSQPGVLILDEPTAGLDPRTEERMMHLFRRIAGEGCTLLLTTHILGSFDLFDRVAVLTEGRMAFYGKPTEFYEYFDVNAPRDVYGRLEGEKSPAEWETTFAASGLHQTNIARPLQESRATPLPEAAPRLTGLRQAGALASRYLARKLKDRSGLVILAVEGPVIAALSLAVSGGVPNAPRTLFIAVIAALWFGCMNSVREIVDEWPLYRRERVVGIGIFPYLLSKLAVLLPIGLVQMALLAGVLSMGGALRGHILPVMGLLTLLSAVGTATGLLLSAISRSAASALTFVPLAMIPQILFAGLLVPVGEVPMLIPRTAEEIIAQSQVAGETLQRLQERVGEGLTGGVAVAEVGPEGKKEMAAWTQVASPHPIATALSTLMAARWGMEGLAHQYVNDPFSLQVKDSDAYYQFQLANSVYFSLYTEAERGAVRDRLLAGRAEAGASSSSGAAYPGVLLGFFLALMGVCWGLLRWRDRESMR